MTKRISTWTCKRRGAVGLALALGLSGCLEAVPIPASADAPARVSVAEGEVVVAGPRGFCVDMAASRDDQAGALVVLGSCAAIAQDPALPQPEAPAVLTAAISPRGWGMKVRESTEALGSYFRSEAGRSTLARSGRAADAQVLQDFSRGGIYYMQVRDTSGAFEPDYWRALVDIGDRIATLSVLSPQGRPLPPETGQELLMTFVERMLAENRGIMAQLTGEILNRHV